MVGEDRGEIAVTKATGVGRRAQRVVEGAGAMELGQVDGLGDFAPHACGAGGSCGDQPGMRAGPDLKERGLIAGAGSWLALDRPGRPWRVVALFDARAPGRGQRVARDFAWPALLSA